MGASVAKGKGQQETAKEHEDKSKIKNGEREESRCDWHSVMQRIGRVVMGITEPAILDNYYVWFKNNCPLDGPLYDDVRFEPLEGDRCGRYFVVSQDCPYEKQKWTLYTERSGFETPEFSCDKVREMAKYLDSQGKYLAQAMQLSAVVKKPKKEEPTR